MMEFYPVLVGIHNILRWVVVVAGVAAIAGAWQGVISGREWGKGDRLRSVALVASLHLQLLLGLILYVQSPLVQVAFDDPGAAMGERALRYFFVEHITMMILAVVVIQVGSIMAKKGDDDHKKHKRGAIFYTVGFAILMAGLHFVWMERAMWPSF